MMTNDQDMKSGDTTKPDDLDAYISTLTEPEQRAVAAAGAAIDIAILMNRARQKRGLSQKAAAELAGLQQQAVSRFESPDANPRLDSIQTYLSALGFRLELNVVDLQSGEVAASTALPTPTMSKARRSA
jgi:DNA-binding phage protein